MSCRLLSYQAARDARTGVLVGDTVYDSAKVTAVPVYASVLGMLEAWSLRTIKTAELNAKKQNSITLLALLLF